MDDIRDWISRAGNGGIDITYGDIKRSAENREHWREMVRREKILRA